MHEQLTLDVPYGYCHCRCGEKTPIARITRTDRGYRKGEPQKYIHGHNGNKRDQYQVRDCGYVTPCWVWLLDTSCGYGRLKRNGVRLLAHRWMYELIVGPIPEGLQIDHLCRNRICVNPAHLEPVTSAENHHRRVDLRLTSQTAREIKALIAGGWPQADIARAYGISYSLVCDINRGRAWREV